MVEHSEAGLRLTQKEHQVLIKFAAGLINRTATARWVVGSNGLVAAVDPVWWKTVGGEDVTKVVGSLLNKGLLSSWTAIQDVRTITLGLTDEAVKLLGEYDVEACNSISSDEACSGDGACAEPQADHAGADIEAVQQCERLREEE